MSVSTQIKEFINRYLSKLDFSYRTSIEMKDREPHGSYIKIKSLKWMAKHTTKLRKTIDVYASAVYKNVRQLLDKATAREADYGQRIVNGSAVYTLVIAAVGF